MKPKTTICQMSIAVSTDEVDLAADISDWMKRVD